MSERTHEEQKAVSKATLAAMKLLNIMFDLGMMDGRLSAPNAEATADQILELTLEVEKASGAVQEMLMRWARER